MLICDQTFLSFPKKKTHPSTVPSKAPPDSQTRTIRADPRANHPGLTFSTSLRALKCFQNGAFLIEKPMSFLREIINSFISHLFPEIHKSLQEAKSVQFTGPAIPSCGHAKDTSKVLFKVSIQFILLSCYEFICKFIYLSIYLSIYLIEIYCRSSIISLPLTQILKKSTTASCLLFASQTKNNNKQHNLVTSMQYALYFCGGPPCQRPLAIQVSQRRLNFFRSSQASMASTEVPKIRTPHLQCPEVVGVTWDMVENGKGQDPAFFL